MAVSFKTALGTGLATSSGTTIVITTTAAIAIGDLVVVRWASDNLNATTPTATCADGGNTYAVLRQAAVNATAAAGVAGGMLVSKATVARSSGSTITVTLSGAVAHKCAMAESFLGAESTVRSAAVGTTGTATGATAGASGTVNAGDLVLGHIANETRGTITGDADTLNGAWSTQVIHRSATSGSDATCVSVAGQYKIATASGAQTYNPTAVAAEWVCQCVVLQATPEATITQAAYQFFDDTGTESGAPALAAINTAHTGDISTGDGIGALRIRVQSTNAGFLSPTDDYQLQWEKNASGSWTNIALTGNTVQAYDNPNLTGTGPTTNRLGAGTGSFVAGEVCEDGNVNDFGLTQNNYSEILYSLKILAADVAHGDTLRFRILRNGATTGVTYTQTPTLNIIRSAVDRAATISSNWGTWSATSIATGFTPIDGTITTSWGTWDAAATGIVVPAAVERFATINSDWGTWNATAAGAPDRAATIASAWGTWTATALALAIDHPATTITAWGTWTATATADPIGRYGTIISSWGLWAASATGDVFTPAAWAIPQNVLATTTGITTITVTWDDVPAATGYDVERNGTVIVYDHPDSPYNDSGLNPDTVYSYRVRAVG